jgi:hypothetical protein
MDVRIASENDKEKWNQFVDREGGSFFQYFDWKYVYEFNSSKHRFIPLVIENETSEILGIFPIVESLQSLYGSLTSLPLGASDGFLLKRDLTESEKKMVIQSFLDYIEAHYSGSHSFLSLREYLSLSEQSLSPSQILIENGFTWFNNATSKLPCTHVLPLEKPFNEKIWSDLFSTKLKQRIRHVKKSNVKVIIDDNLKYKDDFIQMEIYIAKKFGSVEKKEVHEQIFRIFQKKLKLFILLLDSKPIAGVLCYYTPTMAYQAMAPYWPIAEDYLTNTLPICTSIRYACDKGYQNYEMGITSTETLAYYKEKFGVRRIPLMMYEKDFSHFKIIANKIAGSIVMGGKKLVDLFR